MSSTLQELSASPKKTKPPANAQSQAHERRRRRALSLLAHIYRLAESFEEFRGIMEAAAEDVQRQAERNPALDRDLVLNAIHCGAWTAYDLVEETQLARPDVDLILKELVAAGIVTESPSKTRNPKGGRPARLYLPAPNRPAPK